MKLKLHENIGRRRGDLLREAGHDVMTVTEQGLGGAEDGAIVGVCVKERRALITLDHDFGQVLRFPPEKGHGIVILELPTRATPDSLVTRLREFLAVLATRDLKNELWIVEPGRVRVHQRESDEEA